MALLKKNIYMQALIQRSEAFAHLLGKEVEIENTVGELRHLFTGQIFGAGQKVKAEFDGFLRGQLVYGRIKVHADGKEITQADGIAKAAPVEGRDPQGPAAPEQPAETPEAPAETPAAPAAPKILKPKAAQ